MEHLLFSINAILPIFVVILIGFILKQRGFINDDFVNKASKIVFNLALPAMMFQEIAANPFNQTVDLKLTVFVVATTIVSVLFLSFISPRYLPKTADYTAFIQGAYRSNFALIGLALINNISGEAAIAKAAAVLAIILPVYNIIAVLILSKNGDDHNHQPSKIAKKILTNPLIIAAISGILFSFSGYSLPIIIHTPLNYFNDLAMPLSLLTLGGSIDLKKGSQNLKPALCCSFYRLLISPTIALSLGYLLGFRGDQLAIILIAFGAPTAISSFTMAYQMQANHHLASAIIVISSTLSIFSLFLFVFILRYLGLV